MIRSVLSLLCLLALTMSSPLRAEIVGKPRVVDGDTLEIGGRRIDLYGIDAPEEGRTCSVRGKSWSCGQEATFALAFETAGHWVRCEERETDPEGRLKAVCFVGPYDLGARMVRKGWALADRKASTDYEDEEAEARAARAGLWRSDFVTPREWRNGAR